MENSTDGPKKGLAVRLHPLRGDTAFTTVLMLTTFSMNVALAQPGNEYICSYPNDATSLNDIYIDTQQFLVMCGYKTLEDDNNQSHHAISIIKANENGEVEWSSLYPANPDINRHQEGLTLIQTDDGGYVYGGKSIVKGSTSATFVVGKTNNAGEELWHDEYGMANTRLTACWAVIELKAGDLLACGGSDQVPYLAMISQDGNLIWERYYRDYQALAWFASMRETEDGLVLAVRERSWSRLIKVDENGDVVWDRQFDEGRGVSLSRFREGDIAMGGTTGDGAQNLKLMMARFNPDGNLRFWQHYETVDGSGEAAAIAIDESYVIVGLDRNNWAGVIMHADRAGNLQWHREDRLNGGLTAYHNVIGQDNSLYVVGEGNYEGVLIKIALDRLAPQIISHHPDSLNISVLPSVEQEFDVEAVDAQDDSLYYYWRIDGDTVSTDTSISVSFADLHSEHRVECIVSDRVYADSIAWHVTVRDLFIAAYSPDTLFLFLRRGTTQTFSLDTVRAVEGDVVQYQWTLIDLNNFEREETGTEASATIEFLRSGNYQMEGLAYRGESSDNVIWTIAVRSAILDFWPRSLRLSVPPDSSGEFGVIPFNPESDSLSYRWEVDGDSVGSDSTVGLRFAWNGQAGRSTYAVSAIVMDGVEGDMVRWEVTVQDPNTTPPTPPSIEGGEVPATFGIVLVSPNPFNSTTTIRYKTSGDAYPTRQPVNAYPTRLTVNAYPTRLTVHDLTGREVARLVDERAQQSPPSRGGPYAVVFNGGGLPAGVYLLRLEAGGSQAVRKIVLMR